MIIACLAPGLAQAGSITIALVPRVQEGAGGTFALNFDPANLGARKTATLAFDLQALPEGVKIDSAVLRLVASELASGNQHIRIFADKEFENSIGQLVLSKDTAAAESSGPGLAAALNGATKPVVLYLRTDSVRTSQAYYSDTDATSAHRPRLIVSWADPAPPVARSGAELRYSDNPDDATPWKTFAPNGAVLSAPLAKLGLNQILAGPVFRGNEIILIATQTASASPALYGVDWNGHKRWEYKLPALGNATASWKYLRVDARNRLLAFANDGVIRLFTDFGDGGPRAAVPKRVDGMLLSNRPVLNGGGMVTFFSDNGYVYTLSPWPGLDELWRSEQVGKAAPPALSPRSGDGLVYVIGAGGLLAIDGARGERRFPEPNTKDLRFPANSKLSGFKDFHPPLAVAGRDHDWVLLSGFGVATGVLEGYLDFTKGDPSSWKEPPEGPVSRCVAPPVRGAADTVIYCVQGAQLRGYKPDGSRYCSAKDKDDKLQASSNLVADGNGNVYFWNEAAAVLHAFDGQCQALFSQPLVGLPMKPDGSEVLELRTGPNGVFYATSNTELFAIQITRSAPVVSGLAAGTRYTVRGPMTIAAGQSAPTDGPIIVAAIGDKLDLGNLDIPAGADVACSAGTGITFGRGFTVRRGGALRCGIDVAVIKAAHQ